jgi:hypothetical protein
MVIYTCKQKQQHTATKERKINYGSCCILCHCIGCIFCNRRNCGLFPEEIYYLVSGGNKMIKVEDGKKKYFDRNGKEITEGCTIKYIHGDRSLERIEKVYRSEKDELGVDATNPIWIDRGLAVACEYGIYPLTKEETEMVEVVE